MKQTIDPDRTFHALRPAVLDELADEAYERRRDGDLALAMRAAPAGTGTRRTGTQRRRSVLLLAGATAAACAVGAGAVVATGGNGPDVGQGPATPADARKFLLVSAQAAEKAPAGTGSYWYVRTRQTSLMAGHHTVVENGRKVRRRLPYTVHLVTPGEVWVGGTIRKSSGVTTTTFPTAGDQARWRKAGSPYHGARPNKEQVWNGKDGRLEVGNRPMTLKQLAALPSDAPRLEAFLRKQYDSDRKDAANRYVGGFRGYVWGIAHSLLAGPLSPKTKGALYKVLAQQPGIRLKGRVTDALGRHGIAVVPPASTDGGARIGSQLIIAPATGALLEHATWEGEDRREATTYEAMGFVDRLGARLG
ncbi:CU044_5270 family protein [Actinomadura sp. 9N407]|uniref:CU044_5270 family protein n=1 Tax=Actinomadura sp. 9N407 TaxID=3375154 RepID=UPI00379C8472